MIHLQGPPKAPSSIPTRHDSLSPIGSAGSCGPNGRAACTAAWTDAEPSLVLGPTQNYCLFRSLSKWVGVTHHVRNMLPPKSKEAYKVLCQVFGCKRGQSNNLSFTLKGDLDMPTPLEP